MRSKFISFISVFSLLMVFFTTPAQASTVFANEGDISAQSYYTSSNYFTRSTGTMNSLYGSQSRIFNISSGSVPYGAEVSDIELNINVSNGSSPFYLVIEEPDGDYVSYRIVDDIRFDSDDFIGYSPQGTWKVYITGSSYVSTATASMTVNYTY